LARQVNFLSSQCTFPHGSFSTAIFGLELNTSINNSQKLKISLKGSYFLCTENIQGNVMAL